MEANAKHESETTAQKRLFLLQVIQPGPAGLMDGSVSALAPLFAAAFAIHSSLDTFLIGLAASIGAGISMDLQKHFLMMARLPVVVILSCEDVYQDL